MRILVAGTLKGCAAAGVELDEAEPELERGVIVIWVRYFEGDAIKPQQLDVLS